MLHWNRDYVCEYCNKAFTQKSALSTHLNIQYVPQPRLYSNSAINPPYPVLSTGKTPYRCTWCEKEFRDPSVRSRHIEEQHKLSKVLFECFICNDEGRKNATYVNHSVWGVYGVLAGHLLLLIVALRARRKFKRKDVLRKHLRTKHNYDLPSTQPHGVRTRAPPLAPPPRRTSLRLAGRTSITHPLRKAALRRRKSSFREGSVEVRRRSPSYSSLIMERPTRRAAVLATKALSSIIEEEAHALVTMSEEDCDSDDTENDDYHEETDLEFEDGGFAK